MMFLLAKRWSVWLLVFTMLTTILAGCGSETAAPGSTAPPAKDAGTAKKDPKDMQATIKVWDWDETFQKTMIPEFNKVYPNIKVEFTIVSNKDYLQKLQSGIVSGSDVADVILGEIGYRGKLFDLDVLDDLERAPYNFKKDELLDYLVPLLSNSKGKLLGVDQQIAVAGLAYRRDLAKQYLGTDDPAELEKIIANWDAFIAKGIEVKEKSGGKVLMFAGLLDAFNVLKGQKGMEYIKDGQIDLTSRMKAPLDQLFKMREAGIIGKYETGTPSWAASFANGEFLFYPAATWSPKWQVAANDKEGKGRWGLVAAPGGSFTLGGTSVSVYKDSKVKEAAWAFINFCYLSEEGTKIAAEKFGFVPGVKSFYKSQKALIDKGSSFDEFFGGQNLTKYFVEKIAPGVKGQPQTKYESIVDQGFKTLYPLWTKDTSMNAETALAKYISEVKSKVQDASVK
ncbi:MAG: extracellular solute-binding protein [Paenibacillus sp.]|jgi:multiple sugar transport system substrate-binding protein|nr:extracellular solute-binding protein [Paenibacillus sp.]